jgi:7-cyano-7-deazaguanine synthase in queuosine biosynthesis
MQLSEKELDFLEENMPEMMATATKQAFWETLASGESVLIAENGQLLRFYPDGRKEFVKNITQPIRMEKGTKIKI